MNKANITIIGGGVVGSAIAYRLSQEYQDVVLIEKNPAPGKGRRENQTSSNAGVIHAGIYYDPNNSPLKARLCVEGNRMMYEFCGEFGVPHARVGKLLVATDQYGEGMLEKQLAIARQNRVPDIEMVDADIARKLEPNVRCTKALYSQSTGIVNPVALADKLAYLSQQAGQNQKGTEPTPNLSDCFTTESGISFQTCN